MLKYIKDFPEIIFNLYAVTQEMIVQAVLKGAQLRAAGPEIQLLLYSPSHMP